MPKRVRSTRVSRILQCGTTILAALLFSLFLAATSRAQSSVYTKWAANYDPGYIPVAVVADGQGNSYVTGSLSCRLGAYRCNTQSITVKYDSKGNKLWADSLSASPANDPLSTSDPDADGTGLSIALDAQGNVYVLSELLIPNQPTAGPSSIVTAKYSPDGERQWADYVSSTYTVETSGLGSVIDVQTRYTPYAMAVSPTGDTYITYTTQDHANPEYTAAGIIKYDTGGHRLWRQAAGPNTFSLNTPEGIQLDANENAYLLVFGYNPSNPKMNASKIYKFAPDGTQLAAFGNNKLGYISQGISDFAGTLGSYTFPYIFPFYVDAQGNSYVAGGGQPTNTNTNDVYGIQPLILAKFNTGGTLDWLYNYGSTTAGSSSVGIQSLTVDSNGNVFVAQTADLKNANPPGSQGTDITVNKFDPNGHLLWTSNYNHAAGIGFDVTTTIAVDSAGSSYVTGATKGTTAANAPKTIVTIKYDSDGNQAWVENYAKANADQGPPTALTVSGSDVWITGLGGVLIPSLSTGSPTPVWLTINYGQDAIEANPAVFNFGNQTENVATSPQTVTLTNISSSAWIFPDVSLQFSNGLIHFTTNCPFTLNPGQSCELQFTFTPLALGPATGSIIIRDTSLGNVAAPQTITVSGTGVS